VGRIERQVKNDAGELIGWFFRLILWFGAGAVVAVLASVAPVQAAVPATSQQNEWVGPMKMSVKLAEGLLSDVAPKPLGWREVMGGGAYTATSDALITNFAVWGTTGSTKVEVNTWYGGDAHNKQLFTSQLSADDLVCGSFSDSQTLQNWCQARIEATVATNSISTKTVVVVLDSGEYRVPYRFTITTTKDALEIVDIVIRKA
jgi:hypothetical protein